jgi:hypothetical protein
VAEPLFDAETQLRLAEVKLGIQAEDFLASPVGRYLVGRAAIEADAAVELLKKAKTIEEMHHLQDRITLMESFALWVTDAINGGHHAEEQLKHEEDVAGE